MNPHLRFHSPFWPWGKNSDYKSDKHQIFAMNVKKKMISVWLLSFSECCVLKNKQTKKPTKNMWLVCILPHSPAEIKMLHYICTRPSFKLTTFIQWQGFINWSVIWIHSRWKIEVILFLPLGGTGLPIWNQHDRRKHNHLPAISIYMSCSTGVLLLEWEEHFPPTELKFNHQTATLQQNDAIHGMQHVWHYRTCSCTYQATRIDLFF